MDAGPRVLWPDDPGALGLHVDPDLFRRMARAAGGLANLRWAATFGLM